MKDLKIVTYGEKKIKTQDWQNQINNIKKYWLSLEVNNLTSKDEYFNSKKVKDDIAKFRGKVKDKVIELDDIEIFNLRTGLLSLDKILANKNGDIERSRRKFRESEKENFIEEGFDLVIPQNNFKPKFDVYKKDVLNNLKGKILSEFEEVCQKTAFDYSRFLENKQDKFEEYMIEFKGFCKDNCIEIQNVTLEYIVKDIILNGVSKDKLKDELIQSKENVIVNESDVDVLKNLITNLKSLKLRNKSSKDLVNSLINQINFTMIELLNKELKVEN